MIGMYDERITVLVREKGEQTALGREDIWVEEKTIWGKGTAVTTQGQVQYQQLGFSDVSFTFRFPYYTELSISNHRLIYKGEVYEIVKPSEYRGVKRENQVVVAGRRVADQGAID